MECYKAKEVWTFVCFAWSNGAFQIFFVICGGSCLMLWVAISVFGGGNKQEGYSDDDHYISWQSDNSDVSWLVSSSPVGTNNINAAACGANNWVAVGNSGTMLSSPDGYHWRALSGQEANLNAVTYRNGQWFVVGDNGTILNSPNRQVWTERVSGTTATLTGITFGDGLWVVVGTRGTLLTSTNGYEWASQFTNRTNDFSSVTFGVGKWIVSGKNGTIICSTNASQWTTKK